MKFDIRKIRCFATDRRDSMATSGRSAFTLLELLLTTMLSTVLMVGVMAVVTNLSASETFRETVAERPRNSSRRMNAGRIDAWMRLLRRDITHANSIEAAEPNKLTFIGYNALDDSGRGSTHRPVKVTYKFEEINGRRWLIRQQESLDVLTNKNVQRDLVCRGMSKFELVPTLRKKIQAAKMPPQDKKPASNKKKKSVGKTERPVRDKIGNLKVSYENTSQGRKVSLLVNHHWVYPRYAPEWARREYEKALSAGAFGDVSDGVNSKQDKDKNKNKDAIESGNDRPVFGNIIWRLRVWKDDSDTADYDKVVKFQLGGGA